MDARLSALLRASPTPTAVVDADGIVTALNDAATRRFGVAVGEPLHTTGIPVAVEPFEDGSIVTARTPRAGNGVAAVIEQSTDAVIVCDAQGRITEWNPMATLLIGGSADELRGRAVEELGVWQDLGAEEHAAFDRARGGEIARYEARRIAPDG
jgi:PAS domain-containing protein